MLKADEIMNYSYKNIFNNRFKKIKLILNIILSLILMYGLYNIYYRYYIYHEIFHITIIISIFIIILISILLYYVSVFLHELGHCFFMKLFGWKIKLFVSGPLIYLNDEPQKRIRLRFSGILMNGGFVLPKINNQVFDEFSLEQYKKEYIKVLYGGPCLTLLIILLGTLFILLNKNSLIGVLLLIINWPIFINLFSNDKNVFGDIALADFIKRDSNDISFTFHNCFWTEYPLNNFIVGKSELFLDSMLSNGYYNELAFAVIDSILIDKIIKSQDLGKEVVEFEKWLFNNSEAFMKENILFQIKIIKIYYKFLFHQYALDKNSLNLEYYHKFMRFVKLNPLYPNSQYLKILSENINDLYLAKACFNSKYNKHICDLSSILANCSNYINMTKEFESKF